MPGREAVVKCPVMWGLEVGVPGREAMGERALGMRQRTLTLVQWVVED